LVVVGEEVGIAIMWMTGLEHHKMESTQRKVIGVRPEGINGMDRSRPGRWYAASNAVSNEEDY
jgi:hypothetical protein